jgi:hypothetical protein
MVLDPNDPTKVSSMSLFVDGDDNDVKTLTEIHQPDNLETTATGLLVTEDPGGNNQFPAGSPSPATPARLWYVPFSGSGAGTPAVVAMVDHSADGGPTDVDGRSAGAWGSWETSGIVDASAAFGPGAFLIDVQAHTLWVEKALGPDTFIDAETVNPDFTYKREGGQLLLIRIPGI